MKPAPCSVCSSHGIRTMTRRRSAWTVEGGVRVPCDPRPVCRDCEREALVCAVALSSEARAVESKDREGFPEAVRTIFEDRGFPF